VGFGLGVGSVFGPILIFLPNLIHNPYIFIIIIIIIIIFIIIVYSRIIIKIESQQAVQRSHANAGELDGKKFSQRCHER